MKTAHSVLLTGLTPSTTYHYAISSTDQNNRTATRPDATFATPPPPSLVSDDFSAPNLNTSLWTFVNPTGKAALRIVGTGTAKPGPKSRCPRAPCTRPGRAASWPPAPQQVPNRDFGLTPSSTPTSTPLANSGRHRPADATRTSGRLLYRRLGQVPVFAAFDNGAVREMPPQGARGRALLDARQPHWQPVESVLLQGRAGLDHRRQLRPHHDRGGRRPYSATRAAPPRPSSAWWTTSSHRQPHRPRGRPDRRRDTTAPSCRTSRPFLPPTASPFPGPRRAGRFRRGLWQDHHYELAHVRRDGHHHPRPDHPRAPAATQYNLKFSSADASGNIGVGNLAVTTTSTAAARKSTSGTLDAGVRPDRHAHPHGQRPRQRVVGPSVSSLSYSLTAVPTARSAWAPICCASRSPAISRRNAFSTCGPAATPWHRARDTAGQETIQYRHRRQLIGPDLAADLHRQLVGWPTSTTRPGGGRHLGIEGNTIRPQCGGTIGWSLSAIATGRSTRCAARSPCTLWTPTATTRPATAPAWASSSAGPATPTTATSPGRASTRSAPSACPLDHQLRPVPVVRQQRRILAFRRNEILQSASPTSSRCAWKTPPRGPSIAQVVQERQAEPSDWQLTAFRVPAMIRQGLHPPARPPRGRSFGAVTVSAVP